MGNIPKLAFLGGGCFWCLDAVFRCARGVQTVTTGYMGGHWVDPGYEAVCSGLTGHVEVVRIEFDPQELSFGDILTIFFAIHDPTQLDRQDNDIGSQYRSMIFWTDDSQREAAASMLDDLAREGVFPAPVVTCLAPATAFYPAEDYHQDYYWRHAGYGYCRAVVAPKLAKFRAKFALLLKQEA